MNQFFMRVSQWIAHFVQTISLWFGVFRDSEWLCSQRMQLLIKNSFIARAVSVAQVWESKCHQLCFIFMADDYSISLDL